MHHFKSALIFTAFFTANSLPALAIDIPASPLATANTIQVHEQSYLEGKNGGVALFYDADVKIEKPGQVVVTMKNEMPNTGKPYDYIYVDNGSSEHQLTVADNTYTVIKKNADGSYASSLRDEGNVARILANAPDPAPQGMTRVTTTDTLDGTGCILITDTSKTMKTKSGKDLTVTSKQWIDAKTGLPVRSSEFLNYDGQAHESQRVTFTDWKFDQPLTATEMAWNSPAGAKEYVKPQLLAVGATAPDFSVVTPAGKTVHLSDFKGKPVVLDFWATWCGPCQASMPHLSKVYNAVKGQGVQVVAVCVLDDKDSYQKWVKSNKATYAFPTYFDPAGRSESKSIATSEYGAEGIPLQYVIDASGKVAAVIDGYDPAKHDLEANLAKVGVTVPSAVANSAS